MTKPLAKIVFVATVVMLSLTIDGIAAYAQNVTERRVSNWTVRASVDPMSDKKSCLAYINNAQIAIAPDGKITFAVFFKNIGRVAAIEYRFDDNPSLPYTTSTLGSDYSILDEDGVAKLLLAKRLRARAINTNVQSVDVDIQLGDIQAMVSELNSSRCKS
jgi:hypothetical protein